MTMPESDSPELPSAPERIAKRLARAGLCSRRDAERWIAEGRVAVNGVVLTSPAVTVGPKDRIVVDGNPLPDLEPTRLWRYHKPDGLVTSARDEKGRQTVFDFLPADLPRVISVGRLDLTTEGLLLLTNDGELARYLELPTTGWARRYRVRVNGFVDPNRLLGLARGVAIDGIQYGPIEAVLDRQQGANAWMTVTLREGKNREVRNVMESMGLTVNRLIRIAYGPFQLGKLERGEVEEVPRRVLHDQVANFFAERGDKPLEPNTGTAKAKPKPRHTSKFHSVKPGSGGGPDRPRPPTGGKPPGGRPAGRPTGERPSGERSGAERTSGDRTPGNRTPASKHETRRR